MSSNNNEAIQFILLQLVSIHPFILIITLIVVVWIIRQQLQAQLHYLNNNYVTESHDLSSTHPHLFYVGCHFSKAADSQYLKYLQQNNISHYINDISAKTYKSSNLIVFGSNST